MVVIAALRRVPGIVVEQPVLFVPAFVLGLLQLPSMLAQALGPIASIIVSLGSTAVMVFIAPLFLAGILGMSNDAVEGRSTSLGRFWFHGREKYLSMLGAYLLVFAITSAIGVVLAIVVFFGVVAGLVAEGNVAVIAVVVVVGVLVGLGYLAVVIALQFYGHAIVIEGERAIASVGRSIAVVRGHLRAVLGYAVVVGVIGGTIGAAYALIGARVLPQPTPSGAAVAIDPMNVLVGMGGIAVLTTLFGTGFAVYSVTFYRAIVGIDGTPDQPGNPASN